MNVVERITKPFFLAPSGLQKMVVLSIFVGFVAAWSKTGYISLAIFLSISVLLGLMVALNLNFGGTLRAGMFFQQETNKKILVKDPNRIIQLAILVSDPFLSHVSRPLIIPFTATLLTLVIQAEVGVWWTTFLVCLILFVSGAISRKLAVIEITSTQSRRDGETSKLIEIIQANKKPKTKYYIYLRPFCVTGQVYAVDKNFISNAHGSRHAIQEYSQEGKHIGVQIPLMEIKIPTGNQQSLLELNPEWEIIFEKGIRPFGQLIALGQPGESIGAGRYKTPDEGWEDIFLQLSVNASGFFIVPSTHLGTLWEIQWLKKTRNFEGCFFFTNLPEIASSQYPSHELLKETLSPFLRLPSPHFIPSLFTLDKQGRPHIFQMNSGVVSSGKSLKVFITASLIESAIKTLTPIAYRSEDETIDHSFNLTISFVSALISGKSELENLYGLDEEIKSALLNYDHPLLARLWGAEKTKKNCGEEEIYHHTHAGNPSLTVRHNILINDDRFVLYVTTLKEASKTTITGFQILSEQDDLAVRAAPVDSGQ
ncbi:hypothetical protein [Pseudomonas alkylphenolica]|uniref:hypothetical protein n=1 Tax=Pseudomonas alkylphenolica TaxID=237609 RepID=UPI0018D5CE7D|nr:hypothetical protein [Pseudomonas alkylphenolica]MBH3428874.1 hypothetical protein [Pseudomonas alkylphenolica]